MNLKAGNLIHRTALRVEETVDAANKAFRERFGYRQPVRVVPYLGFGTPARVQMRGRVLSDGQVIDRDGMSAARNVLHMLRRYKTDEVPGARLVVRYAGEERHVETDEEGYFHVIFELDQPHKPLRLLERYEVELIGPVQRGGQSKRVFSGCVQVPDNARFVVVSDVDDTIVHTGASNFLKHARTVLLNNALTRTPFPGVAPFYEALRTEQGHPANPIFYVSSSPWNLYELFIDFMSASHIPFGTMFLKNFGMQHDRWLKTSHAKYKIERIRELMRVYPQQGFILVGDSGQKDPEIYCKIARENPGRVLAVYLRDVASHKRQQTENIAREIRRHGAACHVMENLLDAARHAQSSGWITPDELERVRRHVEQPERDAREPRLVGMPVEAAEMA